MMIPQTDDNNNDRQKKKRKASQIQTEEGPFFLSFFLRFV